jgi:hypothetical protein
MHFPGIDALKAQPVGLTHAGDDFRRSPASASLTVCAGTLAIRATGN